MDASVETRYEIPTLSGARGNEEWNMADIPQSQFGQDRLNPMAATAVIVTLVVAAWGCIAAFILLVVR